MVMGVTCTQIKEDPKIRTRTENAKPSHRGSDFQQQSQEDSGLIWIAQSYLHSLKQVKEPRTGNPLIHAAKYPPGNREDGMRMMGV